MNREIIDWERKGNLVKFYLGKNGEQWGDDWNDVPWECNAGRVYDEYIEGYIIISFAFEWNVYEPREFYSKQHLVKRFVPCIIATPVLFNSFEEALSDRDGFRYYFGDEIHDKTNIRKWKK